MATKSESISDIYQIKVPLLGTKPPIWRRLLVPADLTLAQLHNALQIAMVWEDGHMHEFRVGQRRFGHPEPADPFMRMPRTESERTMRLSAVLGRTGAKMIYAYDFGDSWEHGILLEKQLLADPDTTYPVCTDGKLACPPEDCGGIPGYYNLLDALADPQNPEHEEMRDWIGDDFDPQAFSVDSVNQKLAPKRRPSRKDQKIVRSCNYAALPKRHRELADRVLSGPLRTPASCAQEVRLPGVRAQRRQPADGNRHQAGDGDRKGHGWTWPAGLHRHQKFSEYLPFYRIEDIFARQGFEVPRATQSVWYGDMVDLFEPLWKLRVKAYAPRTSWVPMTPSCLCSPPAKPLMRGCGSMSATTIIPTTSSTLL